MNNSKLIKNIARFTFASVMTVSIPAIVLASGSGTHEHKSVDESNADNGHGHHQHKLEWGEPGEAGEVTRTIEVVMGDIYFDPKSIKSNEGDTIRFIVKNVGNLVHEFNIGTNHMHKEHQQEMVKMLQMGMMTATSLNHEKMEHGDMKHDDANSILLEPGESAELIWRFTQPIQLEFACNVPGHYEAGMVGAISVEKSISGLFPSSGNPI